VKFTHNPPSGGLWVMYGRELSVSMDLFNDPVGYFTNLAVFQAKALQNCFF
jgi:hypothetical protein